MAHVRHRTEENGGIGFGAGGGGGGFDGSYGNGGAGANGLVVIEWGY